MTGSGPKDVSVAPPALPCRNMQKYAMPVGKRGSEEKRKRREDDNDAPWLRDSTRHARYLLAETTQLQYLEQAAVAECIAGFVQLLCHPYSKSL
jgi:hypothetical protein